jgi:ribosomal protein S18 acetylase RimI-like enzyme
MKIKQLEISDVNAVVKIHQSAFSSFFLTQLGERFLRVYYRSCIKSKVSTIAVGIFSPNNALLGFSIGSAQSKGYYKAVLKDNFVRFCGVGLYLVFTKPLALIRLAKNMDKINEELNDDGLYCELLSIGIDSKDKGKGYGKVLLEAFENEALKRGINKIALTTDYNNNDGVIAFYKKSGYEVFYEFITYPNRKMYKFIKTF